MKLKVGHCQLACAAGDYEANLDKVLNGLEVKVRADHVARAGENGVWFLRGNNVQSESDRRVFPGAVGYGESYLLDPFGEVAARSQRHVEDTFTATIDVRDFTWQEKPFYASGRRESVRSARALTGVYLETLRGLGIGEWGE